MNDYALFIVALTEARNAWLIAGLRDLYAFTLYEPVPQEWRELARRIVDAGSSGAPKRDEAD